MEEVTNKLLEILKNVITDQSFDFSKVNLESRIIEDIGLNSIGMLYMVMGIEREFDIQLHNISADNFITVGDVVRYIDEELNG